MKVRGVTDLKPGTLRAEASVCEAPGTLVAAFSRFTVPQLRRLFYVSRTPDQVDAAVVNAILAESRRLNRQHDVTGALAYSGQYFAQVLEGDEEHLASLLQRIARDRRHRDLTVVFEQPITRRDYGEWSMGYLYDTRLSDELEQLLSLPAQAHAPSDDTLPRRIFAHISDPANP
jgi:hypothetical protein